MSRIIVLSFLTLTIISTCLASHCPKPEDIHPCKCFNRETDPYIECDTNEPLNLTAIFSKVNKDTKALHQVYNIYISNEKLEEIPENALGNLKILGIYINECSSLKRIHSKAFSAQNMTTNTLWIQRENVISGSSPYNFYELVNSFGYLKTLMYASRIETIEPKFSEENAKLLFIQFTNVSTIKGSPFKKFYRIKQIDLSYTNLTQLSNGAFTVSSWRTNSHVVDPLRIDLYSNKFNSSSFENGVFSDMSLTNMNVTVNLKSNEITYLKENVFSTFLARNGSNIDLLDNPLDCEDCRSVWICRTVASNKVLQSIHNARCQDNERDLTDCSENFLKCT